MKKILVLVLATVMCLYFVACGKEGTPDLDSSIDYTPSTNDSNEGNDASSATEETPNIIVSEDDGNLKINADLAKNLIKQIELTTDNWKDYLNVYSYVVEVVVKDAFGAVTETTTTLYRIGYGTEQYYSLENFAIELQHKETGETFTYGTNAGLSTFIENIIDLDEYECTRIKGYLYLFEIPETVINMNERTNAYGENAYIDITYGGVGCWDVDTDAKVISFFNGSFGDYFK